MTTDVRSAFTSQADSEAAAKELGDALGGADPKVLVFFHSPKHDGQKIAGALHARFPNARIAGSSTCGEFSDRGFGYGCTVGLALGADKVEQVASAMISVEGEVQKNVEEAVPKLSAQLGADLRELDPDRYVGLLLVDSSRMREEDVNEALGNVAPFLSFVGGSSGDEMQFQKTWVHTETESKIGGAVLLVMKLKAPFHVLKACNFEPGSGDRSFVVTRAEPAKRQIWELDGRPAAEVYAEALGVKVEDLDARKTVLSPLALMIGGKPWLRSVIKAIDGKGLQLACRVTDGMRLQMTRHKDIIEDTKESLAHAAKELGRPIAGALMFNCVGRRFELQGKQLEKPYFEAISGFPMAGFHAHGESWLGHINHTLTALLFA